jgi:hypothetical protein
MKRLYYVALILHDLDFIHRYTAIAIFRANGL